MRGLPLLAPQWLQLDQRGRGSHSPLANYNYGSPHSQLQGKVEISKHENQQSTGSCMTENMAIYIDLNSAERVHLYPTRDGTQRWSINRAHPTVRTLGSYGPILHLTLKTIPSQKELYQNCEMPPCCHTGDELREWSHSHLSPIVTP
jgi:hypothetical protein